MKYLKNTLGIIGGLCTIPIIIALGGLLIVICAFILAGVLMLLQLGFIALMVIVIGYAITLEFLEKHFKIFNNK